MCIHCAKFHGDYRDSSVRRGDDGFINNNTMSNLGRSHLKRGSECVMACFDLGLGRPVQSQLANLVRRVI